MVPKFHQFIMPILERLTHGKEEKVSDLIHFLADLFQLSVEDRNDVLPSGQQTYLVNRVHWAVTYLYKAGLVKRTKRGFCQITDLGQSEFQKLKQEKISDLTPKILREKYERFREFHTVKVDLSQGTGENQTPDESLDSIYLNLKNSIKEDLLDKITRISPYSFESLVVDLLINLGYGGSKLKAQKAFQTTRDGGVDGVIYEDKLGLDLIYIQAKRWGKSNSIGRPDIQKFAGALQGKKVRKGIFLTTASFSKDAKEFVENLDIKIILIDGDKLTDYMFESGTGVVTQKVYEVKKVNEDYFEEVSMKDSSSSSSDKLKDSA